MTDFDMRSIFSALRQWAVALVVSWLALPALAQQGEYRLQPGDRLTMSMPGFSMQVWDATIDMTGRVQFPFLGVLPAAGLTLSELSNQIEVTATGLEVPLFENGRRTVSILSGDDVFLQVARYRPVTVVGDVSQPGTVEFDPGLTVRAVLGTAGGVRLADLALSRVPADATVRLQSSLETQKWLRAQVMRNDILLAKETEDVTLSDSEKAALRDMLGADEGLAVIEELELLLRERLYSGQDLQERINLVQNQVDSLQQAYSNYESASLVEEDRLQRLLTMEERGLVTSDRVDNARGSALAASTRLLTVASDVFEAEAELQRLGEDLARLDDVFHASALEDKRRFTQQLAEVSAQISSLRLLLLSEDTSTEEDPITTTEVLIHRRVDGAEVSTPAALGELLYPGDVVEVIVSVSEPD